MRSNTASIWPGTRTSSGIRIGAASSRASGPTYFFALSLRYVTASSAPSARNALAQPQAIDCSLAIPTMRPRFPSNSLAFTAGIMGESFTVDAQPRPAVRQARDHEDLRYAFTPLTGPISATRLTGDPIANPALPTGAPPFEHD